MSSKPLASNLDLHNGQSSINQEETSLPGSILSHDKEIFTSSNHQASLSYQPPMLPPQLPDDHMSTLESNLPANVSPKPQISLNSIFMPNSMTPSSAPMLNNEAALLLYQRQLRALQQSSNSAFPFNIFQGNSAASGDQLSACLRAGRDHHKEIH